MRIREALIYTLLDSKHIVSTIKPNNQELRRECNLAREVVSQITLWARKLGLAETISTPNP